MWFDDRRHGKGMFVLENAEYYIGQFLNDLPHGEGKLFIS